jgi:hypothetical protein
MTPRPSRRVGGACFETPKCNAPIQELRMSGKRKISRPEAISDDSLDEAVGGTLTSSLSSQSSMSKLEDATKTETSTKTTIYGITSSIVGGVR